MKPQLHFSLSLLIATLPMSLALPLSAQQAAPSDTGVLDKGSAEQAFKQRPYSPYAGRNFPARPLATRTCIPRFPSMPAPLAANAARQNAAMNAVINRFIAALVCLPSYSAPDTGIMHLVDTQDLAKLMALVIGTKVQ